jgi:dienelactone hydrolase
MNKKLLLPLVAGAMALAHTQSADACSLAAFDVHQVTYWSAGANFPHGDMRCDLFGDCRLQGWIVAPTTGSNLKAIVMAHGSQGLNDYDEQSLGEYCELTNRLVSNGYVVFWPFRRGVFDVTTAAMVGTGPGRPSGREAGNRFDSDNGGYFQNTGWSAVFYETIMADGDTSSDTNTYYYLQYLEDEAWVDMNDAINFLASYKRGGVALVDKHHIAFGGHSIGGGVAGMASAVPYDIPPTAFISLSGGAMHRRTSSTTQRWVTTAAQSVPITRRSRFRTATAQPR